MNSMPGDGLGTSAGAFLVGDLYIDVGQQRVTRAGSDIALPNLSFRLLAVLVQGAPNIISHESMMTQVWPGLVVSPETVNKRVNLLREALGDDPREPRYIAGVRSRGYRLIAPVSVATNGPQQADRAASGTSYTEPPLPSARSLEQATEVPRNVRPYLPGGAKSALLGICLIASAAIAVWWAGLKHLDLKQVVPEPAVPVGDQSRTVAVLPFDSLSADPADSYLAQGLPEMILNRLSRVEGISVIARNSSFALTTKSIDSREIGRRLNSGYLIGGSVQRQLDRLRVAVHLVDATTATQIWSAHIDHDLHDIFSMEDEIAEQLAGALSRQLGNGDSRLPADARSTNLEAYLAFLRGRTLVGRLSVAESEAAVPFFEKAIALDPNFAPAYASLYDARMQAADQRREDLTQARRQYAPLIARALELDPKLGSAYFARAMWAEQPLGKEATTTNPLALARERDFRQGAALDPSNGRGLAAYAEFLTWIMERPAEGRNMLSRALWVDPMSPSVRYTDAKFAVDEGGGEASERKTLQVLELDPNFVPALARYGAFRWFIEGKLAESIQILEHAIALDPKNFALAHTAATVYLDLDDVQAARAVVAGMPQSSRANALFAMHAGDWRRAGIETYDEKTWSDDSDYCQLWTGEVLRDYALRSGELSRAIEFMRDKFYLGDSPAEHLDTCNCGAALYLSELLAASGQAAQAAAVRTAAAKWIDINQAKYLGGVPRLRARALLLDGKPDAALAALAQSFRSGFYGYWWYTLNLDPLWVPLHDDPRFRAISADVHRYLDAQHSELEALRRAGLVPRRDIPAVAR